MFYVVLEGYGPIAGEGEPCAIPDILPKYASETREAAQAYRDRMARGFPANVYTVHEGDPLTHRERQAAAERDPYQIDPTLPLELEDGTPVELELGPENYGAGRTLIRIRTLSAPTGYYPGEGLWWHNVDGGACDYDPTYLRVRNVVFGASPLPAWKAKAAYAERTRPAEAKVPWKEADWHKAKPEVAEIHFPHLAMEGDVPMVAFYASEQHAERERLTKMRPGRYLKRYFGETLDNEEIERLTAEVTVQAGAMTVRWTQDADEIETIYVNGPSSCMSEDVDSYLGHCHPSRVYAGPDLAVAWLGDMDDATARCVVWPDEKQYGTIYGDCSRMRLLLEQQGFKSGEFRGARFQRIESRYGNGLIIPYLDFGGARDNGEFLIANGDYTDGAYVEDSNTCGTTEDNRCSCDRCGDSMSEADAYSVDEGDAAYCEHCVEHYTLVCDYAGERYRDNGDVVSVEGSDDYSYVHTDNLADAGFVYVTAGDRSGEYWPADQTFTCDDCGDVFHEDDRAREELDRCGDCEEARNAPPEDLLLVEAAGQMRLPIEPIAPACDVERFALAA